MKHLLRSVFLVVLAVVGMPKASSIRIIENTMQRLVFSWEMGDYQISTVTQAGKAATAISFDGENILLGEAGEPAIPGYSAYVGIPQTGNVSAGFSAGEVATVALDAPLSAHQISGKMARQPDITFSNAWISDPRYTSFRQLRASHIVIRPFMYDEIGRQLRILKSGTCTIEFPPSARFTRSLVQSDQTRMLKRLLINFDIASGWVAGALPLRKRAVNPYPLAANQKVFAFQIGDGRSGINEATVKENGIIRISGQKIIELFGGSVAVDKVALYASPKGEMPTEVPALDKIPAGISEIPLLRFDVNKNGAVDSDDYFLAYVTGNSDWQYDSIEFDFVFKLNRYDDYRRYLLTVQSNVAASIPLFSQPIVSGDTVDTFTNRIMLKESKLQPYADSEGSVEWVWSKLTPGNAVFENTLDMPQLEANATGSIRIAQGTSSSGGEIRAFLDNRILCDTCQPYNHYPVTEWGSRRFRAEFRNTYAGDRKSYYEIRHLEIKHTKRLTVPSGPSNLLVFSSQDPDEVHYRLSGLDTVLVYIFRLRSGDDSISLIDTVRARGLQKKHTWSDSSLSGARYFICTSRGFLPLTTVQELRVAANSGHVVHNLRDTTNTADFLIVTHEAFTSEAERLAAHKQKIGFKNPRVIEVNDIYRSFSGGNTDPVAIRNFIAFAARHWREGSGIDYVILMGSGHYDFKGVSTREVNYVPVMLIWDKAVEDFYVYLTPGDISFSYDPDISLGRLPCMNTGHAKAIVDKIIDMEDPDRADFGAWRNRMLLVADDDMQGATPDPISSTTPHHWSSDKVYAVAETRWPSMDLRKVYLFEYGWNELFEKPEASRAIINEVNSGVAYVNYFGHGAETVWADEHILTPESIMNMFNRPRYAVFSSFSCSVGKFDKPDNECLSDILVRSPGGGAIASISSTRLSYANSNEDLAIVFYESLFDTLENLSIGMAFTEAKLRNHSESQRSYSIIGDPSIKHVSLHKNVSVGFQDMNGKPLNSLKALQQVKIVGTISDRSGVPDRTFGSSEAAFVHIGLFNPSDSVSRKDGGADNTVRYSLPGSPLFAGVAQVRNGAFEQTMLLPRNLAFNRAGVKLLAYAWQKSIAGVAYKNDFVFSGTEDSFLAVSDTVGPRITMRPVYDEENMSAGRASFAGQVSVLLPVKFEIDLYDQSGVDVVGTGPDEGLTMEIQGVLSKRNINYKFQFSEGDYRQGSATLAFEEGQLNVGRYTMVVSAQDLLGNISQAVMPFDVVSEGELRLDRVFNFPNPVRMGKRTKFYYYHSNTAWSWNRYDAQVTIKIYSMSGKLLRVLRNAINGEEWDGTDQAGRPLSPNVYLYRVSAHWPHLQKTVQSKIRKLVIHPPR